MKLSPSIVAVIAGLATVPVAAAAASAVPALADQAIAWVATAFASAIVSAIAAAVTKITGAQLDKAARDALQTALTNAANAAIPAIIRSASDLPMARRLEEGLAEMLAYLPKGAPGAISRFGLDAGPAGQAHLRAMAEGRLISKLQDIAPDQLASALGKAGLSPSIAYPVTRPPVL